MKNIKNLNDLAVELTEMEGGRIDLPIAQIKEVLKCLRLLISWKPILIIGLLMKGLKDESL